MGRTSRFCVSHLSTPMTLPASGSPVRIVPDGTFKVSGLALAALLREAPQEPLQPDVPLVETKATAPSPRPSV